MRIQSKYQDIYDGPASYGAPDPEDRVLVRKPRDLTLEEIKKACRQINYLSRRGENHIGSIYWGKKDKALYTRSMEYLFFCGRIYPFIITSEAHSTLAAASDRRTVAWTAAQFWEQLRKHVPDDILDKFRATKSPRYDFWRSKDYKKSLTNDERLARMFISNEKEADLDLFREIDAPYFMIGPNSSTFPNLRHYHFMTHKNPAIMAQELDQFLHSTLTEHPRPMAEVSDKDRIQQHGFDPKWSFRRHKDEVTKKRKKK